MMANMPTNFLFVSNNIGKYKMQTADWLQNADYRLIRKTVFFTSEMCQHLILQLTNCDPIVMQSPYNLCILGECT